MRTYAPRTVKASREVPPTEPEPGERRPKRARSTLPPLLTRPFHTRTLPWTLFAAALAAAVLFAVLWQGSQANERRRAEVASTASSFLLALTNFSGTTIESDIAEIRSYAVGDFAEQVEMFFDPQAVAALRQAQARSVGQIRSLFVESLSGGSATVFGVVDEAVSNAAQTAPRTELIRIDIEMIETTEGWKVNRVNILQSPGQSPFP
ncbi:MAG TPA: hypothetical protein VGR13_02240 [Actinomycetota bacterium]|nr:hypothetical protein [Actinomycetota bacterium]